jgi:hypothetical protein
MGADDYLPMHILDVYATRGLAEQAMKNKTHLLISRSGEPRREIIEKDVVTDGKRYVEHFTPEGSR